MRPGEPPTDGIEWIIIAVMVAFMFMAVMYLNSCSLFRPVAEQTGIVPPLARGGYWVGDINDGLPLVSTPHRIIVWRDWSRDNDGYHFAPETSEPNIFTALENVPATLGSALPTAAGTSIAK